MNMISSNAISRTAFEQFLLENFGLYVDVSGNLVAMAFAAFVLGYPLLRILNSRAGIR